MGIPKIIFSPESHHPPHPCISGEIRHHPSAQLVVLFVVVSSFSRVVAISPSTPCLLLDKFTAPEFRKVARELSDLFFPSVFPKSTLRPSQFKTISVLVQIFTENTPRFSKIEPAVQSFSFCLLAPIV